MLKKIIFNILIINLMIFINIFIINELIYKNKETKDFLIVDNYINNVGHNKIESKYLMYISIPSINLKKGIYKYDSKYNNVKYGIELLNKEMPNKKNGNLILASHNGNSNVAYFSKLDQMHINDKIIIYYQNKKYIYKFNNKYEIEKTGKALIKRNINKNSITLITCKKNSHNKQIIYIGYLE